MYHRLTEHQKCTNRCGTTEQQPPSHDRLSNTALHSEPLSTHTSTAANPYPCNITTQQAMLVGNTITVCNMLEQNSQMRSVTTCMSARTGHMWQLVAITNKASGNSACAPQLCSRHPKHHSVTTHDQIQHPTAAAATFSSILQSRKSDRR